MQWTATPNAALVQRGKVHHDLAVIRAGEHRFAVNRRIEADDAEFNEISERWSGALRDAFASIPDIGGV
ncbi:MAG: hypothetical protein AAFW01_15955, partial [Pseudomonadota bacterium]